MVINLSKNIANKKSSAAPETVKLVYPKEVTVLYLDLMQKLNFGLKQADLGNLRGLINLGGKKLMTRVLVWLARVAKKVVDEGRIFYVNGYQIDLENQICNVVITVPELEVIEQNLTRDQKKLIDLAIMKTYKEKGRYLSQEEFEKDMKKQMEPEVKYLDQDTLHLFFSMDYDCVRCSFEAGKKMSRKFIVPLHGPLLLGHRDLIDIFPFEKGNHLFHYRRLNCFAGPIVHRVISRDVEHSFEDMDQNYLRKQDFEYLMELP